MKRTNLLVGGALLLASLFTTSCDEIMSNLDQPVKSYVQIDESEVKLLPGETNQRKATTISTEKIFYKSSDEKVATVDQEGVVTAVNFGEATITVSVEANDYYEAGSASYPVKVGSVLEAAFKDDAVVELCFKDGSKSPFIKYKAVDGNLLFDSQSSYPPGYGFSGYNPTTGYMTWYIYDTSQAIMYVEFNVFNNTYKVVPILSQTTITFDAIKINGVNVTSMLKKLEVAPKGIYLNQYYLAMYLGYDATLIAYVDPADATDKKVTWSSSNEAVATVDQTGKVHPVAVGTAIIKATINGKEAQCTVEVKEMIVLTSLDEGFEGGVMPEGWVQTQISGNGTWTVGVGDYVDNSGWGEPIGAHSGNYNAKITHAGNGYKTMLITPVLNLSGQTGLGLSYWFANRSWSGDIDKLTVYYRTSSTADWTELQSFSDAHEAWTNSVIALPNLSATYQIAFEMTDGYGYGIALDDVKILGDN